MFKRALRHLLVLLAAVLTFAAVSSQASTSLVIAEIYGGGGNSGATYSNDFVVVFNPTASAVDINGWSIQYASASGTSWQVGPLATTSTLIPAGGYFLVRGASQAAVGTFIGTPDATNTINMSATSGKVALCNSTNALTGTCPTDASIIDFVGFGSANCSEGSAAASGSNTASMRRKDGGCADTDSNSSDFETASPPTPRSSASPTQSCDVSVAPSITAHPQSRTNNAGTTATFTVSASGTGLTYEWKKGGNPITDFNALGVNSSTLTITNVGTANAGSYHVVVANTIGSVPSNPATLTVIDPAISTQPTSRTNVVGDTANFFVGAGGTDLVYQWYHDGASIPTGTDATLNVTDVQMSQAGNYSVVVANSLGNSVTSSVVTLTMLPTPSTRIARWDFNGNGKVLATPAPSETITAASAALVGGTTALWSGGSFSDPGQAAGLINEGWNTATYPAANAGNKTAGVQFNVSTVGYQDVFLFWEQRHSNTASKYSRLQYSVDGVNFVDGPVLTMTATNNGYVVYSASLAGVSGLNNNANAAFRIVSEFQSTATGSGPDSYAATVTTYGTSGTVRFDLFSVYGNTFGTATPIPITAEKVGNNLVLSWSNPAFVLQSANAVNGPYNDVVGATSPYPTPLSGTQRYFRLIAR